MKNRKVSTTKLSTRGQVVIPKDIRMAHHWQAGQELVVMDSEEGVVLKPASLYEETTMDEVARSLPYTGPAKSVEEMEEGIARAVRERTS